MSSLVAYLITYQVYRTCTLGQEDGESTTKARISSASFSNAAFDHLLPADKAALCLYPEPLRKEIDQLNDWMYATVNTVVHTRYLCTSALWRTYHLLASDGVYKAGFATTQKAYEDAVLPLFDSLDRLEKMLVGKHYLLGNQLTEADIRLFVSIVSVLSFSCSRHSRITLVRFRYASMLPTTGRSSATFVRSATVTLEFTCGPRRFAMCHVCTS